jgi:GNAT superfamily N-acetyltransferase
MPKVNESSPAEHSWALSCPAVEGIREARVSDLDSLTELLALLFAQEAEFKADAALQRQGLRDILRAPSVGTVLVAEQDCRIVGMVNLLYTVSTALGCRVAWIEDMVVSPQLRRHGVGRKLLDAALVRCRQEGCRRITLLTDHDNWVAHRLYRQRGFAPSSMNVFRCLLDVSEDEAR